MKSAWIIRGVTCAMSIVLVCGATDTLGADWPVLGRDGSRNCVSPEKGAPTQWTVAVSEDGKVTGKLRGIRWAAPLGAQTHSSPVVSGGLIWVGTSSEPRKERQVHPVLKCFREADGKLLYEYDSPKFGSMNQDPGWRGLGSSPLIEGDRLWLATNRGEVFCLDIGPLIRNDGPPRELWRLDLIKQFDISPFMPIMGPPRPCSIGPSWNGRIFVTTNNGVSDDRQKVPKPQAPSVVCLNKDTGEVYWKDSSPGANILLSQFASPTIAEIAGQMQVIVPQSDGWVRSFHPMTGEVLWEFDINAKTSTLSFGGRSTRSFLMGNAVVYDDRVYVASGKDVEQGAGPGRLVCIDPTRRGDISSELAVDANGKLLPRRRIQAVDVKAGEKAVPNPNSGLVWEFTNVGRDFTDQLHLMMGSVAVADGLLIASDLEGLVQCFDARTGQRHWSFDTLDAIWNSPLIADGKIYVGLESDEVLIFRLTPEPHVPLARVPMDSSVCSSPVFANGTLYIASQHTLLAIEGDKEAQAALPAVSGYWPQWRGIHRDNISKDTGLMQEWPAGGPPLRWRVTGLGSGISTVSVAGGRIFGLSEYDKMEYVRALDERTGTELWTAALGATQPQGLLMRWLTQRPPTVDGERLYAMSLLGELVCLRVGDGKELWRTDYGSEFNGQRGVFGYSDCPIVDDDRLLCSPGGAEATIVALDKKSGKVLWKCAVPDAGCAAYSNGIVATIDGQRQFITCTEKMLVGVAVADGKLLWRLEGGVDKYWHPHTPHIQDRFLTIANGFSAGLKRLKIESVNGVFEVSSVFSTKASHFIAQYQDDTMVVGDRLFEPSNGVLSCMNTQTGDIIWQNRLGPAAATTYADGRLYMHFSGLMKLVADDGTKSVVKSEFTLPDAQMAMGTSTPIITGGRLYVREDDQLLCYDIRAGAMTHGDPPTVALGAPERKLKLELQERTLRSVFVPTPADVVDKMLELASVKQTDVVFDLGSGDGRIVIAAAQKYGCKAVGYELDTQLVATSNAKAVQAGVEKLVTFETKDLFTADLSNVDVLAVYLLPQQLTKLLPQLEKMKPGSRVISHQFLIPEHESNKTTTIRSAEDNQNHAIHVWVMPLSKPAKPAP